MYCTFYGRTHYKLLGFGARQFWTRPILDSWNLQPTRLRSPILILSFSRQLPLCMIACKHKPWFLQNSHFLLIFVDCISVLFGYWQVSIQPPYAYDSICVQCSSKGPCRELWLWRPFISPCFETSQKKSGMIWEYHFTSGRRAISGSKNLDQPPFLYIYIYIYLYIYIWFYMHIHTYI